jgi:hypothetical protein
MKCNSCPSLNRECLGEIAPHLCDDPEYRSTLATIDPATFETTRGERTLPKFASAIIACPHRETNCNCLSKPAICTKDNIIVQLSDCQNCVSSRDER